MVSPLLPQVHVSAGGQAEEPKGLLWILDEEALIHGSSDSAALDRLCSCFAQEGIHEEGKVGGRVWGQRWPSFLRP